MKKVHIANADFELELTDPHSAPIDQNLERYPTCLQLQFLPLLYALPDDLIAVTALPDEAFLNDLKQLLGHALPPLILLKEIAPFQSQTCVSWGPSLRIQKWAEKRKMNYSIPLDWSIVQKINSKAFSMTYSPLAESVLLDHLPALSQWLNSFCGTKVLKTCFGFSGLGHLIIDEKTSKEKIEAFCQKEWKKGLPIIGEAWLNRIFDFSTQWILREDGQSELLGSTVFETSSTGGYQGTLAGSEESIFKNYLPFLHEHICIVKNMLEDVFKEGYFGHIGVDALLYRCSKSDEIKLYPIVEINGRKTLSFVALLLQRLRFPSELIRLSFKSQSNHHSSLLPTHLMNDKGKLFIFKRKLILEKLSD